MVEEQLTLENLLSTDGFVPYNSTQCSSTAITEQLSKTHMFELLHREDPIKKLKKFGMFADREHINGKHLEYTGGYNIDESDKFANYLMSRTYVFKKEVKNNMVNIDDKDFDFDRFLYHITIKKENNETIDEKSYIVRMNYFDNKYRLIVPLTDGFIDRSNQYIYDIFGKHRTKIYNDLIKPISPNTGHIFNTYTDSYDIIFYNTMEDQHVIIECKVYDIYAYGGFFNCGWR